MDRARLTGLGIAAALAVLCALLLVRPDEEGEQAPTPPPLSPRKNHQITHSSSDAAAPVTRHQASSPPPASGRGEPAGRRSAPDAPRADDPGALPTPAAGHPVGAHAIGLLGSGTGSIDQGLARALAAIPEKNRPSDLDLQCDEAGEQCELNGRITSQQELSRFLGKLEQTIDGGDAEFRTVDLRSFGSFDTADDTLSFQVLLQQPPSSEP